MSQDIAEGAPRGTLAPVVGGPVRGERGRFSAQRKMEAVLRLVRGETLDAVSRELGVSGSTLSGWQDRFLAAGQTALKSRPGDERDDEIQRLRAKVGEITMDNELLLTRCRQVEAARPLALRRLKP